MLTERMDLIHLQRYKTDQMICASLEKYISFFYPISLYRERILYKYYTLDDKTIKR